MIEKLGVLFTEKVSRKSSNPEQEEEFLEMSSVQSAGLLHIIVTFSFLE